MRPENRRLAATNRQILLSLPPAMVGPFRESYPLPEKFAAADPAGSKLGSGGGLVHLLYEDWLALGRPGDFADWAVSSPKLAILAGGQSRRLPAYAATGKVLTPLPALRWGLGQHVDGTLLDFMTPEFDRVLSAAGEHYPLMVCSGDVLLHLPKKIPALPKADVLGLGMWVAPEAASDFGVFFTRREKPTELEFFLQKPSPEKIREISADHLFMVDVGVWLLSKDAVRVLLEKCGWDEARQAFRAGRTSHFELYADFGPSLGRKPLVQDPAISPLQAAVVPLRDAAFYHVGTSRQLIESISALQNRELDQQLAAPMDRKPNLDVYVQNADFSFSTRSNRNRLVWVENSTLAAEEKLGTCQVITGVPAGMPSLELADGVCLDVVPIGEASWCLRFYGFDDRFSGKLEDPACLWFGRPVAQWLERRGLTPADLGCGGDTDIQLAPIFPVVEKDEVTTEFLIWLHAEHPKDDARHRDLFLRNRLSAMEICEQANLRRLLDSRRTHLERVLPLMRAHHRSNPFYRLDLSSAAALYPADGLAFPPGLEGFDAIHDAMFRSSVRRLKKDPEADTDENEAFRLLRETIVGGVRHLLRRPRRTTLDDQIVWGRSPVRLDLAGGWTDTPPYCFKAGGAVLNVAADINGQPPVQVFLRFASDPVIVLRSIDLGTSTTVQTWEELARYDQPGDSFSLARAALCLAGFHPALLDTPPAGSLREQLIELGGGLEISLLAAAPKGSGLGTSSILAATLLGTLSDACDLGWDHTALISLSLALEQMLTTCGGWQDQAGGIHHGVKFIETAPGILQEPSIRWAPDSLLAEAARNGSALLYFTGITRMASGILREIVRGMFLNSSSHLRVLSDIHANAGMTFETMLRGHHEELAKCVARSWDLNRRLDRGTDPPAVQEIFARISDHLAGGKLLGAGGGGYALFLAKDPAAGQAIRRILEANPPNRGARFVDFSVSSTGLQITRS